MFKFSALIISNLKEIHVYPKTAWDLSLNIFIDILEKGLFCYYVFYEVMANWCKKKMWLRSMSPNEKSVFNFWMKFLYFRSLAILLSGVGQKFSLQLIWIP